MERLLGKKIEFAPSNQDNEEAFNASNSKSNRANIINKPLNSNDIPFLDIKRSNTFEHKSESVGRASHPIGKQWILYVNNKEQNWQHICEQGKNISHTDEIIWKF